MPLIRNIDIDDVRFVKQLDVLNRRIQFIRELAGVLCRPTLALKASGASPTGFTTCMSRFERAGSRIAESPQPVDQDCEDWSLIA